MNLHPAASALSAFRILPNGIDGRAYSIAEAPDGRAAIERTLRRAAAVGYVTSSAKDGYAVLDVLDDDDDIVQDFGIPSAEAFRWWKRTLHLTVTRQAEDTPA